MAKKRQSGEKRFICGEDVKNAGEKRKKNMADHEPSWAVQQEDVPKDEPGVLH